ncbi:MAG: hypothetical protein ABI683_06000 [Ginsengibacter sp.]
MDNNEGKATPPLLIWVIFSIIALIVITGLFYLRTIKKENDFTQRSYYLQHTIKAAGIKPVVLILGTSLTRCAYDSSSKIEKFIQDSTGKRPVIAKVWSNGTNLETIINHMPVLMEIHPDILVVEANMFCYAAEDQHLVNEIPSLLYSLTAERIYKPYLPEEKPKKPQDNGEIKNRNGIIDTSQLYSFKLLASSLEKQGTKIILVNIPVEASEEIKKWSSSDTLYFNRNMNYVKKEISFTYCDPKQYWDMSYYYNRGHLNLKGCKAFTQWFCEQLSEQVKQL